MSYNEMIVPITALYCFNLQGKGFILSGEGCMVKVFSSDGHLHCSSTVFPHSSVIHGFTEGVVKGVDNDGTFVFVVFGQRLLKVTQLTQDFKFIELSSLMVEDDWVFDVHYIPSSEEDELYQLVIMYAHNCIAIVNHQTNKRTVIESEVKCSLYSARLEYNPSINILMIASGTVFNDILIHSYKRGDQPGVLPVSLILKGHEGVIFDIHFNTDYTQAVTVSDDRSVRVWPIPCDWFNMSEAVISSIRIFRGHVSRVWSSQWLTPTHLISIGEDGTARVWNEHSCIHVERGHQGSDIWSVSINEHEGIVVTGGGDCGIHCFNYRSMLSNKGMNNTFIELPLPKGLSPRILTLVDNSHLLCMTDVGTILKLTQTDPVIWSTFNEDRRYGNYAIMKFSKRTSLLAIGNLEGLHTIINCNNTKVMHEWCPYDGKVFSLTWLSQHDVIPSTGPSHHEELLLSCGPDGSMYCWSVQSSLSDEHLSINLICSLYLPVSKHRWVTCGLSQPSVQWMVCGDRKGSIYLYDMKSPSSNQISPLQSYTGIHGSNGVTNIKYWKGYIYTTGRDGYCRQFMIKYNTMGGVANIEMINKFHPVKGVDWIEGILFTEHHGLLLQVFHGRDFIIYSHRHGNELIKINCGGGHRSSAMTSLSEMVSTNQIVFYYVKGNSVYCIELNDVIKTNIIKESFISRECVTMCHLGIRDNKGSSLIAIGSEDCTVTILAIEGSDTIRVINTLKEHISVVKAMAACPSSSTDGVLLFTGGGRASVKSWIVYTGVDGVCVNLCCEYNIHNLPMRPQRRKKSLPEGRSPPECRIMSLTCFKCDDVNHKMRGACLVAGCSDGVIRIYLYPEDLKCFNLIGQLCFHNHCILAVKHSICHMTVSPSDNSHVTILYTCSTDGSIAIWDCLHHMINGYHDDHVAPIHCLRNVHQSGINDIAILTTPISDSCCTVSIASVGDDNAVMIHNIIIELLTSNITSVRVLNKVGVANAHHSPITGVVFMSPDVIVTSSVDQRLSVWSISSTVLTKVYSSLHNITDASSLVLIRDSLLAVCGIGMELVTVKDKN